MQRALLLASLTAAFGALWAPLACNGVDDSLGEGGNGSASEDWHLGPCPGGGASHSGDHHCPDAGAGHPGSGSTTGASSGGATTSGSATSASSSGGTAPGNGNGGEGLFQAVNPWNTAVDGDPKSASSGTIIQWLGANGGWGTGAMRIDFSINLLHADASTPMETFTTTSDFYSPDCDHVPFPVPSGGALEGESGYVCTQGGDCHLLVVHGPSNKLYEMWRANLSGGVFHGGCTAVWDLGKSYPPSLRGDGCTSADAGGFPIAAMLVTADEVAAGEVPHAIRFILPNARIRGGNVFVHPGSHTTAATSGGSSAPPYGVRFRLRADYPLASLPTDGARVVARAMQKYGMLLADGGNMALTFANDAYTTHKWANVGVTSQSLLGLQVSDFEVVDLGSTVSVNGCTRNP